MVPKPECPPTDAGAEDASTDSGADAAADECERDAGPQVCLSVLYVPTKDAKNLS